MPKLLIFGQGQSFGEAQEREGMERAEVMTAIHEFGGFTEQCARTMQNHREQLGQRNLLVVSQFSRELRESRNSC